MDNLESLFSENLTDVDITPPIFPKGKQLEMEVADCHTQDSKDKTSINIAIRLVTVYDEQNNKGGVFNAGYCPTKDKPTVYISLRESEKRDMDKIRQDLKRFQLACGRSGAFGDPTNYIGCRVKVKTDIEKDETGQFPDKNRFIWVLPPATK